LTVDEELQVLDESIRRLKIEYDVYFGGGSKKPPADTEWRVQSLLKKYSDSAAPSMDAASYMQAFPPLQEAKADWLKEELKIPSRGSYNGVAIFAFPLAQKDFDARKNLTLRIQFYDRPTLVATSPAAAKP